MMFGSACCGETPQTPQPQIRDWCKKMTSESSKDSDKKSKVIRDKKIQIRLTEDEKNQILENASGLEISTFLRTLGLNQEAKAPEPKAKRVIHSADPELVREVARIGININQIAKHLNITERVDREIFNVILKIKADLDAELERLKKSKVEKNDS